ncbi:DEAD/DEAH box helicase [Corynebacterium choanae]|uniref:DEAD/DEAH box helicase n=1 Tax=Corynebacterium choanae TaxID=1862358 RepID=UPI003605F915
MDIPPSITDAAGFSSGPADAGALFAAAIATNLPDSQATSITQVPGKTAVFAPWPQWVSAGTRTFLADERGIGQLYRHQAATAEYAFSGQHVIVATGTASGKSLGYQLPMMEALIADPAACALYLAPTKALANNQLQLLNKWSAAVRGDGLSEVAPIMPSTYDGDTPSSARRSIRDHSRLLISNPDMVHTSLCARHQQWGRVLRNLRFIVLDEAHVYRGVFGANVALVVRRVLRLAKYYGAEPVVVLASATTADPTRLAQQLVGEKVTAITEDGSPRGKRTIMLWEPGFVDDEQAAGRGSGGRQSTLLPSPGDGRHRTGQDAQQGAAHDDPLAAEIQEGIDSGFFPASALNDDDELAFWGGIATVDDSCEEGHAGPTPAGQSVTQRTSFEKPRPRIPAWQEAATMMATTIAEGGRTVTFARSRRQAEIIALRATESLVGRGCVEEARRVSAYRAGYLAEDRRRLEQMLDSGELLGVAATNALELGVDIGGLDAVIVCGWPGTVASFYQQAGRAGRRGQSSLVALVARDDPLDQYLIHHPETIIGGCVEATVFNPANPFIQAAHLYCAAVELPLTADEIVTLDAHDTVEQLSRCGLVRWRGDKLYATPRPLGVDDGLPTPETAHAQVSLRGASSDSITIVSQADGTILGDVNAAMAASHVHPGAVYLHLGRSYVITALDYTDGIALADPAEPEFSTHPLSTTDIRIINDPTDQEIANPAPGLWIAAVDVEVTTAVTGYRKRYFATNKAETVPLTVPPQTLVTRAVSYTLDPLVLDALGIRAGDLPGALHAAEHAAIGLLPLIAACDRWDIGGVSTAEHPDTGLPTVFVYDGHPGGAGFADEGFRRFHQWITATFEAVSKCSCAQGCPSCVVSPKCGNGNNPLDKHAAATVLGALVAMTAPDPEK